MWLDKKSVDERWKGRDNVIPCSAETTSIRAKTIEIQSAYDPDLLKDYIAQGIDGY